MEGEKKKKDTISKLIMAVCFGVLLLVVVMPTKNKKSEYTSSDNATVVNEVETNATYYEQRLKDILEHTYGVDTMEVMVHVAREQSDTFFYEESDSQIKVDGVLVVAQVKDSQAVSDITFAVCALFDLPAHKVAVMIKK